MNYTFNRESEVSNTSNWNINVDELNETKLS